MAKFDLAEASDVEILLRVANRADRLIRLSDVGIHVDSDVGIHAEVVENELRLLADAMAEWIRRYPIAPVAEEG
jgi:hypothetical protein